jgi:hypothetical protein
VKFPRATHLLLGFVGPKAEAEDIKRQLAAFLRNELGLELSEAKTLITHAQTEVAHFLGYEVQTFQANGKHDDRGQRCINGHIGLRVPRKVIQAYCAKYMRHNKPIHLMPRVNDSVYSITVQYQAEYVGIVQYYRLAYNLHQLGALKWVMEMSLTKTLAHKLKITRAQVYHRYRAYLQTDQGTYVVLQVTIDRGPDRPPLTAHFGGVPLRWNQWVRISDEIESIWSKRSEVEERLLAQKCELCGSTLKVEVHHVRKLADLDGPNRPEWMRVMAARHRKSLVVCQSCHNQIHAGRYDGPAISKQSHGRAV